MNPKFIIGGFILIIFLYWISQKNNTKETKNKENLQLVNFCTDWCGISQDFLPVWKQVVKAVKSDPTIQISTKRVKCDASPEHDRVCDLYDIKGYPTIKLIGSNFSEEYTGKRTVSDILAFIKSKNQ